MTNNLIDLYKEYVRCADMCIEYNDKHKTNVTPRECVQLKSATGEWVGCFSLNEPDFVELLEHKVRFAVAIVEGRPVFVGDTVYDKLLEHPLIVENGDSLIYGTCLRFNELDWDKISWNPPKKQRTFTLNGVELPIPRKEFSQNKVHLHMVDYRHPMVYEEIFFFETIDEAVEFYDGLRNILRDARDKE